MRFSETQIEQTIDRIVWGKLRHDREYLNAEDAEAQSKREAEITEETERYVRRKAENIANGYDDID